MRKIKRTILTLLLVTLLGSLLSGSALAKEIGTDKELRVENAGIQTLTELVLLESENGSGWSVVDGTLAVGYTMGLNPALEYEYLDAQSVVASPALADGVYGFVLDPARVPADFYPYWAAKGVVSGATGDLGILWNIITGVSPMFYLKVSGGGTTFDLLDGFLYQAKAFLEAPLRVNGDYPVYTYNFQGTVQDSQGGSQTLVVGITFNRQATVSIVGETFTIDGCGYIDLYIHVANAVNLYALDLSVSFDKNVVEVVDLDPVAAGVNLEPVDGLFDAAYWVYNQANNATGEIRYAATQYRPSEPMTGSDNIAKIRLRAKAFGTSQITMTAATLSDRDGYLVGVPVTLGSETITTQFTAASEELDLGITRVDASTVRLNWPAQTTDTVQTYTLHRSTLPYFTPGTGTVYQTITNNGTVATFDDPVLGNVADNYFYTMQIACKSGLVSPYAWQVGKFEYTLYETNTRDYTWVGFVLDNPSILYSRDLADYVEDNIYSGSVVVKTISRWNPNSQNTTTYNHDTGASNFEVSLRNAYRVEIDITNPNVTNGTVIWAQVGRLPAILTDTYTLYETNTTDYSWILLPLDRVNITNTLLLADSIRSDSSAPVNVLTIGYWNGPAQTVTSINTPIGGTSSLPTRFGYPYRVEVHVQAGSSVTWP